VPGLGPTVFVGSYDGNLHAFDARTGDTRWTAPAGGRVSGGATIVGSTVYFADLDAQDTLGVSTRTGRQVFKRGMGKYDPIVSDGRWLYLTGGYSLQALKPIERRAKSERKSERQGDREKRPARKQRRDRGA
jgi:outer membrane protein assembly factor BamB